MKIVAKLVAIDAYILKDFKSTSQPSTFRNKKIRAN